VLASLGAALAVTAAARAADGYVTYAQGGADVGTFVVGVGADGNGAVPLAGLGGGAFAGGSWSPDGTRFAYSTDSFGYGQVFLRTVFDQQILNTAPEDELDPSFAPDGATLAVAVQPFAGHSHLALFTAAGGRLVPFLTDGSSDARHPHFSPDGRQIAFDDDRNGTWDVFVMNADGTNVRDATPGPANDHVTDWSPDGLSLLVSSDATGNGDLYSVNLTTGSSTRLTTDPGHDIAGVYAPSGTQIAFSSDVSGRFLVYVAKPDGSGMRAISNGERDIVLDWQPRPTLAAPKLTVLPATIVRGKPLAIRYRLRDDDGYDLVSLVLFGGTGRGGELDAGPSRIAADGRVQTLNVDAPTLRSFLGMARKGIRLCVNAIDPHWNGPTTVCRNVPVKR
jgi:TolB protein